MLWKNNKSLFYYVLYIVERLVWKPQYIDLIFKIFNPFSVLNNNLNILESKAIIPIIGELTSSGNIFVPVEGLYLLTYGIEIGNHDMGMALLHKSSVIYALTNITTATDVTMEYKNNDIFFNFSIGILRYSLIKLA